MKTNRFICTLLTLAILLGTFTIPVMAEDNIKVLLNGTELSFDVLPQLINSRTMVPMRKIFEALGATVDYKDSTQTVTAKKDDILIIMQIDNVVISVNGKEIILDVPPQLIDSRTLVPVRAVVEGFNADVKWNEDTQTVIITKEGKPVVTANPATSAPTVTSDKLIYKNNKYGYSFEHLSYWELMKESKDEAVVFISDDTNDEVASTLTISIGSPSVNLSTISNDYMERVYTPNYTSFKITSSEMITVDGVESKRFTADGYVQDISLKMAFYIFNIKDNVCTFASVSSEKNIKKDISELDSMFKSMKFENVTSVNTKRVGEANYGYLTIPSNWVNFMDATVVQSGRKSVGFANRDGVIINLDYFGSSTLTPKQLATDTADRQKKNGADSVEVKEVKINDMDAHRVECYYSNDNSKLFIWFFYDKNKGIHFISAEGSVEKVAEAVEIAEKTFSLVK
jgi:hypothetical protein